ncbi:MAG: hypothetical protein EOO10_15625 [Chitinophagaceae bacterium]|nr:MAG: hypothetical protein EOO10_15625 [Chitinophagaceae bacterium]
MKKSVSIQPKKQSEIKENDFDAFIREIEEDFKEMDEIAAKFQAVVERHLLPQTYKAKQVSNEP